jgi:hypothetical protein
MHVSQTGRLLALVATFHVLEGLSRSGLPLSQPVGFSTQNYGSYGPWAWNHSAVPCEAVIANFHQAPADLVRLTGPVRQLTVHPPVGNAVHKEHPDRLSESFFVHGVSTLFRPLNGFLTCFLDISFGSNPFQQD